MNDPIDVLCENGFKVENTDVYASTGDKIYYLVAENGRKFSIIMSEVGE